MTGKQFLHAVGYCLSSMAGLAIGWGAGMHLVYGGMRLW